MQLIYLSVAVDLGWEPYSDIELEYVSTLIFDQILVYRLVCLRVLLKFL